MTRNPYRSRLPVEDPLEFRGRRREVRLIMETIGAYRPGSVSLVGYRRIGKTSTLRFVQSQSGAIAEFASLLSSPPDRYLFVFVDLEFLRIEDGSSSDAAVTFFRHLLTRLHHAVEKRLVRQPDFLSPDLAKRLRKRYEEGSRATDTYYLATEGLEEYLRDVTLGDVVVVMLLDEADAIVKRGFGHALRSLVSTNPLAYVLATQKPLHELDPEQDLSPLFNLCTPVPLGVLDEEAAHELVVEPAARAGLPFSPAETDFILSLGGGHPDFLKVAAMYVFDARAQSAAAPATDDLIPAISLALEGSCKSLLRGLNADEVAFVRAVADGSHDTSLSRTVALGLSERGLLVRQGDGWGFFSPLFRDYVRRQPATEPVPAKSPAEPAPSTSKLLLEGNHIVYGNIEATLTPLEMRILRVLSNRPGQPVSRQEIYEGAWNDGPYEQGRDATINVAVQRLRGKLKSQFRNQVRIEAERGEGYSLVV
ncbi:MAG: winged helix-turn-helix domain-containing protein [Anaerolineae bacterium]